jgi:hypothetical protein
MSYGGRPSSAMICANSALHHPPLLCLFATCAVFALLIRPADFMSCGSGPAVKADERATTAKTQGSQNSQRGRLVVEGRKQQIRTTQGFLRVDVIVIVLFPVRLQVLDWRTVSHRRACVPRASSGTCVLCTVYVIHPLS